MLRFSLSLAIVWIVFFGPAERSEIVLAADSAEAESTTPALEEAFRQPPAAVKPWAYWWWLKGNVDRTSITHDLEAMKRIGFGGLLMFDARGYHEGHVPPPPARMEFMSPEWRRMLRFAIEEADRLGLKMSVNLSSCAGALKGPWPVGDDAPKRLVWTAAEVQGPGLVRCELPPAGDKRFWDIAVMAARLRETDGATAAAGETTAIKLTGDWQSIRTALDARGAADRAVDLTSTVSEDGKLAWEAPPGRWTILRFAAMTMEGHEYDVDVLDPAAVEGHFGRMGKALLEDAGPLAGKTLTHFYSVSWEGAIPTWTLAFEKEFERYRSYPVRPYLPVLAGFAVHDVQRSERLLRDYYKTLGDLFRDNFYGKLRALSNREGIQWHSESGGPWRRNLPTFKQADQLAFLGRNDMPQGEFWVGGRAMNRPAAMTAHTYGLPRAATEAFTHMQGHWSVYPALIKPDADAAFCDGTNHFIWHTFTASPPEFGKPGIEYFAGTHINPNVTWFEQAGGLITYLARCQAMLRHGHFAADVCCYVGDKPYQHWGRGEKWTEDASLTLGKGYAYDLINTEVLLERLTVDGGDLVLPDGMRYRVLVVDLEDTFVCPAALDQIFALARQGATVVLGKTRPTQPATLRYFPIRNESVQRMAYLLWGSADAPPRRTTGKGTIFVNTPLDDALSKSGIRPDYEGPFDFIHRRGDGVDVYFLAGSGTAECTFRVNGREPEFWDPVSGQIRDAVCYQTTDDGRTVMPIKLPRNGSVFVVFRKPAAAEHVVKVTGPQSGLEFAGRGDDGTPQLRLWTEGQYVLEKSDGREVAVEAADLPESKTITGPWTIEFTPGRGAPESAVFEKLVPWNEHPDNGIRHFAGTGTYRTTLELTEQQAAGLVRLELGEVRHVAEVRLSGEPLGVVWTAPWSVDLTGIAKPGRNELEIAVTNVWANRLIADAALPPEKRITKTNVGYFPAGEKIRAFQGYTADAPLMPSGLIGPVRLEFGVKE